MKRYAEYKDSGVPWIGEVPADWEIKKIKHKFYVVNGATPKSGEPLYWDGDIMWVTPADYKTDDIYIRCSKRNITSEGLNSCGTTLVPENSIIISNRAPIGSVGISIQPMCTNQGCKSLVKHKEINIKFVFYYLSITSNPLNMLGRGTTFLELSSNDLSNFSSPCPNINIQNLIADYLDRKTVAIDSLIEDKQKLIELLKEKRQAVISEAVTKGLDKNAKMKDCGIEWIGEIPEDWKRTKLKNLLSIPITDGPHETPEILDEGIPFISAEAIKNLKIDFNLKRGYISMDNHLKFCKKCKPEYGDIFMIKSGATTGNVAMVETYDEFNIWSPLALIRNNPNIIHNKYLFYYLQSRPFRLQVELFWSFGTQQNIGMGVLGNLYLSYPETDVQIEIVSYLNTKTAEIDNLEDDITKQIEKLKEYRQAIISEAVTGKVAI